LGATRKTSWARHQRTRTALLDLGIHRNYLDQGASRLQSDLLKIIDI
jgi:phage gp16-like protein